MLGLSLFVNVFFIMELQMKLKKVKEFGYTILISPAISGFFAITSDPASQIAIYITIFLFTLSLTCIVIGKLVKEKSGELFNVIHGDEDEFIKKRFRDEKVFYIDFISSGITSRSNFLKDISKDESILKKYQDAFQWIMVDEFQDINEMQFKFIKLLSNKPDANILVIGDPDQSIYGFRGASGKSFQKFKDIFPSAKTISLTKSFRCPQNIITGAGQALGKDTIIHGKESDISINIIETETNKSEANWIAS